MIRPLPRSTFFFFNDPATTEIYTLSLHDALPILRSTHPRRSGCSDCTSCRECSSPGTATCCVATARRSEEHTSELQSQSKLVCRLLLEKKKPTPYHVVCSSQTRC